MIIPHNRPSLDEKEVSATKKVLLSKWIGKGQITKAFERKFSKSLGINLNNSIAVSSGSAALYIALKFIGVNKNDYVIVPAYSCTALLNAINLLEAKPLVLDINLTDLNISLDQFLDINNTHIKAAIIPHTYGVPSDILSIKYLKIPIIEDCASSIGAKINNQPVGTFGDLAIFSFGATKFITTGGGGMIVSRKDKYIERIRDYINYDYRKIYYPRFNFDFNDIQASIGIAQLEKLNDFIDRRKYIANKYIEICNKKGWNFQKPLKNEFLQNWYRFVLFLPEKDVVRLHNHLKKRGVSTIIPLERWELLNSYLGLDPKYFSNSVKASKHTLSVPIYPSLTEANLEDIIDALTKF